MVLSPQVSLVPVRPACPMVGNSPTAQQSRRSRTPVPTQEDAPEVYYACCVSSWEFESEDRIEPKPQPVTLTHDLNVIRS